MTHPERICYLIVCSILLLVMACMLDISYGDLKTIRQQRNDYAELQEKYINLLANPFAPPIDVKDQLVCRHQKKGRKCEWVKRKMFATASLH